MYEDLFSAVQESMVKSAMPEWEGIADVCSCGFKTHDVYRMVDQLHAENCTKRPVWKRVELTIKEVTGRIATVGFLKHLKHYYRRSPYQTSLRCSSCADAPTSPVHVTCEANWPVSELVEQDMGREPNMTSRGCWEPAMGPEEPYCEFHWLDLK